MKQKRDMKALGSLGGKATATKYGSDHFRRLQALSWQKQKEKNPNAGFRLGYAGLKTMDVASYNGAWSRGYRNDSNEQS